MKIALIQYSSNFGGSTISGQMIAESILAEGWDLDIVFGFDGPFVELMNEPNCKTHIVPHRNWLRGSGLVRFLRNRHEEHRAAKAMELVFRDLVPDVVYVNSLVSYAAVRAAHRLGIPVVWHIRELFAEQKGELHWPTSWARPWIRRVISQSATALVVNSNTVRRNVLGANALGNITVIPNAVPDSFFHYELSKEEARKTLQLPGDVPLVGFPGTLRPVKAHHVLLDAIPTILAAIPDCVFAVTGVNDSDYSRDLIKQAQASEFGDRIVFTGAVADMQAFYRACNVCCIASESESFGRTAVEAFASRTPLVSTTSGGLNDIVNHDVNSLAVDFGSAAQLSRAVVKILEDGSLAACLTKAAFEEANELYSQAKCAQSVTSVIRDVAVASGSHAA